MKNQIQKIVAEIREDFSWEAVLCSLLAFAILASPVLWLVSLIGTEESQPAPMVAPLVQETQITEAVNALAAALNGTADMTPERIREYDANVMAVENAQAFQLYLMGFGDKEIAEHAGVSVEAVRDWRTANRLLPGAPMHSTEYLLKKAAAREWWAANE